MVADQVLQEVPDSQVHYPTLPLQCHPGFARIAYNIGLTINDHTQFGRMVTVQHIVNRSREKQEIAERTGAIGLDMESAIIGQIAIEKKIPFIVIRAISDLMDEDLPDELNLFLRPFGWVKGLPSIIASPRSLRHIVRLQSHMVQTSRQMTKFFDNFFRQESLWDNRPGHQSALG